MDFREFVKETLRWVAASSAVPAKAGTELGDGLLQRLIGKMDSRFRGNDETNYDQRVYRELK